MSFLSAQGQTDSSSSEIVAVLASSGASGVTATIFSEVLEKGNYLVSTSATVAGAGVTSSQLIASYGGVAIADIQSILNPCLTFPVQSDGVKTTTITLSGTGGAWTAGASSATIVRCV